MNLPKRKQNRLDNFDYSSGGAYFITICTRDRKKILSEIVGADTIRPCEIKLLQYGKIVDEAINNIANIYENMSVDKYVIMPDHVHIILQITKNSGRIISAPTVIAGMKRYVSKKCGISIWQKGFYDHIIRNQKDYNETWQYIEENPAKWLTEEDEKNKKQA